MTVKFGGEFLFSLSILIQQLSDVKNNCFSIKFQLSHIYTMFLINVGCKYVKQVYENIKNTFFVFRLA